MFLATKLVKRNMKMSMSLRLSWLKFPCSFGDKLVERNCRKEHGNFHVPSDKLVERNCRKEHGNFHVPSDKLVERNCRKEHGKLHVPCDEVS